MVTTIAQDSAVVGRKIRRIRKEHKMTARALAQEIGVTEACICRIERGFNEPRLHTSALICRLFGISLDELVREEETP